MKGKRRRRRRRRRERNWEREGREKELYEESKRRMKWLCHGRSGGDGGGEREEGWVGRVCREREMQRWGRGKVE